MNIDTIVRLLRNSGLNVLGHDSAYIYIEDPACITRSFETFANYAWIILCVLTAFLLAGWAISMIRNPKQHLFTNMRTLTVIFATLSMSAPLINVIWGGDLFGIGCKTIKTSITDINEILDARKLQMSRRSENLYEEFDIYDSGVIYANEQPEQDALEPEILAKETTQTDITQVETVPQSVNRTSPVANNEGTTPITTNTAIPTAAAPAAQSNDVIYTYADGSRVKRTGGSRAWRNSNPGNLRYTDFSKKMGAIGSAGGFAVFPDEETGMRAIKQLMLTNSYRNLTIKNAITRYAPPAENDTEAYRQQLEQLTGLDIDRLISDLTDDELGNIVRAIRNIEGWTVGRIIKL